eukprot:1395086-Amorphochlora_amoeboformis.AAC.1
MPSFHAYVLHLHHYCNCMRTTTTWLLQIVCFTRGYLGSVMWVDCVTLRDVTSHYHRYYRVLSGTISTTGYYRILPDVAISKNLRNLQRSPAIHSIREPIF